MMEFCTHFECICLSVGRTCHTSRTWHLKGSRNDERNEWNGLDDGRHDDILVADCNRPRPVWRSVDQVPPLKMTPKADVAKSAEGLLFSLGARNQTVRYRPILLKKSDHREIRAS